MMASLSKASTSRSSKLKPGLLSPAESEPEKSKSTCDNEGDPALPKRTPPPEAAQRGDLEFLQRGLQSSTSWPFTPGLMVSALDVLGAQEALAPIESPATASQMTLTCTFIPRSSSGLPA